MRFKGLHLALTLFAAFAAIALLTPKASAQNVYGTIRGTVTDPSGAVVPGATVVIRNNATNVTTQVKTDSKGTYVFPEVQPGTYDLTVTAEGFTTSSVHGLQINVNTNRQENFALKIGSSQTVQVQAAGI
ncbi:MAG: carboxypeptidase-like regulatory domain-containing protein, partial [Acidobacteriaceae bacterium]